MKLSVVVLNYNSWDDTFSCLKSLSAINTIHEISVVVVDNGSDNKIQTPKIKIQDVLQEIPFTYIGTFNNLGFTGGNNIGIRQAQKSGADYILLLNNDTIVDNKFIDYLVATSVKFNDNAIVGAKIYFAPGYEFHRDKYNEKDRGKVIWFAGGHIDWNNVYASHLGVDCVDIGQFDKQSETDFISGCCMLIPISVLNKVGLLDNKYFLYYEDVDFCMRAKKIGVKLIYEPLSVIWHKNAQSSGKSGSRLHLYYQTRNRLIFGMRYAPIRAKLALVRESVRFWAGGGTRRRAMIDYFFRKWGKQEKVL